MGEALQGREIGIEDVIVIDTGSVLSLQVFVWVNEMLKCESVIEQAFLLFLCIFPLINCFATAGVYICPCV